MSTKSIIDRTLKSRLTDYLAKKAQATKLEAEMKELKTLIDRDLDIIAGRNDFQNGKLGLPGVAMISVALNPPKLIWAGTGKALDPADREGLALLVPEKFVKQDVRIGDLFKEIERQVRVSDLSALLADKGISVVQESRYDVKAA